MNRINLISNKPGYNFLSHTNFVNINSLKLRRKKYDDDLYDDFDDDCNEKSYRKRYRKDYDDFDYEKEPYLEDLGDLDKELEGEIDFDQYERDDFDDENY